MPYVVPYLVAFFEALGAGATIATVAAYVVIIAAEIALSYGIAKLTAKNPNTSGGLDNGRTQMVRAPDNPRMLVYGRVRTSGTLAFIATTGASNEYLHLVLTLASHKVNFIDQVWLNDEVLTLDSGGNEAGKYSGVARVKFLMGDDNQAADSDLVADTGGYWSTEHRLRGVAGLYARIKFDSNKFPAGIPNFSAIVSGREIYDFRTSTTAWSDNPVLCIYDYMRDTKYGLGCDASEFDIDSWIEAANICDEEILVAGSFTKIACSLEVGKTLVGCQDLTKIAVGMTVSGTGVPTGTVVTAIYDHHDITLNCFKIDQPLTVTADNDLFFNGAEKRYTLNGTVNTSQKPSDIISSMLSSMSGEILYAGGQWVIHAAGWRAPTITLDEGDMAGGISVQTKLSRRDRYNAVKGVFVSPHSQWQPADLPAYIGYVHYAVTAVNASTDVLTCSAHLANGKKVKIISDGALPGGILAEVSYYVLNTTTSTLQLSLTSGGSAIDITDAGSGTIELLWEIYLDQDGGERIWRDVQLAYTTSPTMGQRLEKIELERGRQEIAVTARFNLNALKVRGGDVVNLSNTRMGWTAKPFEVTNLSFSTSETNGGDAPTLFVELSLRETASGVYDWNNGQEQPYDLAPNTNLPDPFTVGLISGLTLVTGASVAIYQDDGTVVPRLEAYWTTPSDQFVKSGGRIVVQYKVHSASDWVEWDRLQGDATQTFITDVRALEYYDVRVASISNLGVQSAWVSVLNFQVLGDNAAPGVPTSFTVTSSFDGIYLAWRNPTDKDLDHIDIYELTAATPAPGSGSTPLTSTKGQSFFRGSIGVGQTRYYWVRSVDRTGNASAWVGPQNGTTGAGTSDTTPPGPVTSVVVTPGLGLLWLSWTNPSDSDLKQIRIYQSATTSRPGSPSYVQPGTFFSVTGLADSTTLYFWLETEDTSGNLGTIVGPASGTTSGGIDLSDLVPGLTAVEIVSVLPTVGNFDGRIVFLSTDKKLYRYNGTTSAFTTATDGADIIANTITAGAIQAGAITATAVGANLIVTNTANIGTAVITAAKIASVDASAIQAGTISAAIELSTARLTAGSVATGAARFNPADYNRYMPFTSYGEADLVAENGGPILPAQVATSPGTVFYSTNTTFIGWTSGSTGTDVKRFGFSDTHFHAQLEGNANVPTGRFGHDIVYRINGGSWNIWTGHHVVGGSTFENINQGIGRVISGLTGSDTIEWGVQIDNGSATGPGFGELLLSVEAFNG
jgi:hypothetical protein